MSLPIVEPASWYAEQVRQVSDFVSGPRPASAIGGAIHDAYRFVADEFSNAVGWVGEIAAPAYQFLSDAFDQYYSDNGYSQPTPTAPYTGGQCNTDYTVEADYNDDVTGPGTQRITGVQGPIQNIVVTESPCVQLGQPGTVYQLRATGADGVTVVGNSGCLRPPGRRTYSGFTVSRDDGLPDTCGNPPPVPTPGPTPAPLPPPRPPGQEPIIDDDGRPVFPVPPVDDPFGRPLPLPSIRIPLPGDLVDPPPPPPPPGDQGEPGTSVTTDGGTVAGDAPPNSDLVGVLVELLSPPPDFARFSNAASPVYRGALYVKLGGDDGQALDLGGGAVKFPQFFYAPPFSTKYEVSANVGFNIRVTPYYREREAQLV